MAIQVIDKGPHKSVVKEVVCTNCGATLAYTPSDVYTQVVRDYGGGADDVSTIRCPQCEHNQVVR